MISETSIYQILKGLSNGERKIFSKALKQQKKPEEYIQVYSYLIRKNSYDNRIRMKIINICGTKQKSRIVKKYLFELALKIIKSESPVSLFRQLNQNLIDIEILYNRGLFDEMNKLIQKGMKLAKEAEETEFLLILLRWQEFYFGATSGKNKKIIASISEEREETIESINEVNSIEKIYKIVLGQVKETYHDRKGIRIKEGNLQVDKIKSFMGLIRYYEIQSIIAFQSINYHEFHEWNKKILSLVESKKIWLEIHKEEYILFLSTCLYSSSLINDLTDIEKYLSKLNDLETNNSIIKICKYRELIPSKLFFILNSEVNVNRIEKAIIELVEQYSEIKQNLDIEGSMIIIGNFALAYFKIKRFEEAHYWNNQLLSIKNRNMRKELIAFAKIFDFVIQFDRKEYFYVKQKAKQIHKQFKYSDRKFDLDNILCSFFSKIQLDQINEPQYCIDIFGELKTNLHDIYKQKEKANFAEFFNFEKWVDEKLKELAG